MPAFKIRLVDACLHLRFGWSTHVCIQDSADRRMSAFEIRLIDACLHSRFGWSTHVCIQDSADRLMSAFKIRLIDSCLHSRFGWSTHVCIGSRPFWCGSRSGVGGIRRFVMSIIGSSRIFAMQVLWKQQCCGTVTIFYGSGSGSCFRKVLVPVPVPTFEKVMTPVPVTVPTFEKLRFRFQLHI